MPKPPLESVICNTPVAPLPLEIVPASSSRVPLLSTVAPVVLTLKSLVKPFGGAFGTGLWQEVKEGYTAIAHVYEEGDDVYLFGFSRGAYTARSLAGMIATCGLPSGSFTDDCVTTAFQ